MWFLNFQAKIAIRRKKTGSMFGTNILSKCDKIILNSIKLNVYYRLSGIIYDSFIEKSNCV